MCTKVNGLLAHMQEMPRHLQALKPLIHVLPMFHKLCLVQLLLQLSQLCEHVSSVTKKEHGKRPLG